MLQCRYEHKYRMIIIWWLPMPVTCSHIQHSIHVKYLCWIRIPTSACLFLNFIIFIFVYVVLARIILIEIVPVYCCNIRHNVLVQCHALTTLWMFEITLLILVIYCGRNRPIHQSFKRWSFPKWRNNGDAFKSIKMSNPLFPSCPFSRISSRFCSLPVACGSFLSNKLTSKSRK
jgi:hypothetical protein